jgi:arylsulfatase A-like enzyme
LDPQVHIPERSVLLISVDGLCVRKLDEYLAAGDLPNIQKVFAEGGVRVRAAVATQPTITYANFTTILTGRAPGSHGILGNKWFDRFALFYRDYTTTATYRFVDDEFAAPTVYERLANATSASVQSAVRRGATRIIDNWATSGVRWYFGYLEDIDWLEISRLEEIARDANRRHRWPSFIHLYLPAVDEIGHRHGCDSAEYRHSVMNVDAQIGRLHAALSRAGLLDRTDLVLTSDHGHIPVPPENFLNVADWLRQTCHWTVIAAPPGGPAKALSWPQRRQAFAAADAVVTVNGDRVAAIHVRGPHDWCETADPQRLALLLGHVPGADHGSAFDTQHSARWLWDDPAVALVAAPAADRDMVELISRSGRSRIDRRRVGNAVEYRYDPMEADALGDWSREIPGDAQRFLSAWHDEADWLRATAGTQYPDVIVQLAKLFDSARAGDVVLFAALDWDFAAGNAGSHGSIFRDEALVPMFFAGPDLPHGGLIDTARLTDVTPTMLGLLSIAPQGNGRTYDGHDLTPALRAAEVPTILHP